MSERTLTSEKTLTLALHGVISLPTFAGAITHFERLVTELSRHAAPGRQVRWVIDELHAASAITTVRAEGDEEAAEQVTNAYLQVGTELGRHTGLPYFPESLRREALALTAMMNGEVTYLRFETPAADVAILPGDQERAVEIAPALEPAYGGVQGRIQTLSSRGRLRFTLYDTLFDRAVACYLTEGQEDIMRDAWGRVSVVEGVVARDPLSGRAVNVRSVRTVTPISEVEPDAYLAARGVLERTAEEPEELIRRLRDAG